MSQGKQVVVRRGSLVREEYLQSSGKWGAYETAKRFKSAAAATDFYYRHHTSENYGIFPTAGRRR